MDSRWLLLFCAAVVFQNSSPVSARGKLVVELIKYTSYGGGVGSQQLSITLTPPYGSDISRSVPINVNSFETYVWRTVEWEYYGSWDRQNWSAKLAVDFKLSYAYFPMASFYEVLRIDNYNTRMDWHYRTAYERQHRGTLEYRYKLIWLH
jgi:hypothetical protein